MMGPLEKVTPFSKKFLGVSKNKSLFLKNQPHNLIMSKKILRWAARPLRPTGKLQAGPAQRRSRPHRTRRRELRKLREAPGVRRCRPGGTGRSGFVVS